jgi:hypothetical protein
MERNIETFITLTIKIQAVGTKSTQPSQGATDDFAAHSKEWWAVNIYISILDED